VVRRLKSQNLLKKNKNKPSSPSPRTQQQQQQQFSKLSEEESKFLIGLMQENFPYLKKLVFASPDKGKPALAWQN
jgi:hypothetical protein